MGKEMQPKPASNASLLALPDGTELVGDYRIKRVLGAGGFGITYLADEIALARVVTVKEYFPADFAARGNESTASPRTQECAEDYQWGLDRFIEEAQTLARFVHPNIVRVYRYFRANNTGYMVLHFEEGGSFKSWLKGLNRAPRQAELDQIVAPLLDALAMVHKSDFLHRDIAPDNIIIRKDGSPVLIDFGSARGEIASHSKTVSALVKPGYSPYEQYATTTRQQGPWTDIYALGATLYHAVTGKRPPDAPSRMVNDEYIAAREAALSSYRPSFLSAIDKALKLEIAERPQSIAEWRGALLAPEPQRGRSAGMGLGLALGRRRLSTAAPPPPVRPADAPAPVPDGADNLVPSPPDAPQPKGQLLDFIDALKKRHGVPGRAPKKAAATPAPKPAHLQQKLAAAVPVEERPSEEPPQFGLGYGPPPEPQPKDRPAPAPKKKAVPSPKKSRQPPAVLERRAPPRPRRLRSWRLPSRQWNSVVFKLLIGLGIAGLAVAYQEKMPRFEGRGANVVSSQAVDLVQPVRLAGHKGPVLAVANADQGRWIISAGADGTLRVWNAGSGSPIRTIELDEGPATALAVDDQRALTGHGGGSIALWDLERAEKLKTLQFRDMPITSLAFTADPNLFVVGSAAGVAIFDIRAPSAPASIAEGQEGGAGHILAAAHFRGLLVASGQDRYIRLWRTETGTLARTFRDPSGSVSALDITSAGRAVVSGSSDGFVRLWSTGSSRVQRTFRAHEGRVTSVAFAPNDRLVASAGADGQIKVWDLRAGRRAHAFRNSAGPMRAVSFSADGRRIIATGDDGVVRLWPTSPPAVGN
jgi:WD40 repeat protein/serine/threonine protein kinase